MSKLDELIAELCPNGVEYKELQRVLKIRNGSDYKSFGEGEYPVYGSGGIMTYVDRYAYDKPSVLIPRKGSIDKLYYVDIPFWNVDTIFYTEIDESEVMPRFVYHCLLREHLEKLNTAGGVPSLTQKVLNRVKIPVPPLEVQREIVRVLDNFTFLSAELSAELSARRKQYEYYREKLLTFNKEIKMVQLRNIVDFRNGKGHEKDISIDGKYIVVNSKFISTNGEVKKYTNHQICPLYIDDILMVMSDLPNGRALAKCFLVEEDDMYSLNQRIGAFHVKSNAISTRFLLYVLNRNRQLLRYDNGVDQTNLRKDDILNILIPIPERAVQDRIVYVLDNFETFCNDLEIGLPAEVEARQKQYEYYRDLLLTFAETGSSILTDRQTEHN